MKNEIKLSSFIKGSRVQCILAPLFKMLEATLELFVPLVMAAIIDKGIANSDKPYIFRMCGVLILLGAVGLAFSITAQYFAADASVNFVKRIRHALFEHIGKLSFESLDSVGTSTLITRMTADSDEVQNGLNLTLRLLLRSPFVVIGAMVMSFTVDKKAALTFAVVIPLLSIVVFGIMLICIPLNKKVRSALDRVVGTAGENLAGVRVIRAFGNEEAQVKEFTRRNDVLTRAQEFTGRISALLNPVTCVIINIGIAVLIYIGALRVDSGAITSGAVVALYNYMSQILVELIKLANLIISITKSVACGERIKAVLAIPAESEGSAVCGNGTEAPAVEFRNVSFAYAVSGENSLENISFKAFRGETVGIIGSTGSGKTTLVNLIPAFYPASSGEVLLNGTNVSKLSKEEIGRLVAVVPQKAAIFKGTVRKNMLWGDPAADDEKILRALETAQAKDFVLEKDGGLDAVTEHNGRNFSGGQKQRLTVARALLKNAEIMIFDDSSSALDYATDAAMRKAIAENYPDAVRFIVSQRTSSVMNADRIIVLEDGKAQIGTHGELMESSEVYREIHLSQFDEEVTA